MGWLEYGVLFAVAAVVTIALTPLARKLAIKLDAIDYPSARRVNMLPIPRMGGVAIFGGILAALAVAGFGNGHFIAQRNAVHHHLHLVIGILSFPHDVQ